MCIEEWGGIALIFTIMVIWITLQERVIKSIMMDATLMKSMLSLLECGDIVVVNKKFQMKRKDTSEKPELS